MEPGFFPITAFAIFFVHNLSTHYLPCQSLFSELCKKLQQVLLPKLKLVNIAKKDKISGNALTDFRKWNILNNNTLKCVERERLQNTLRSENRRSVRGGAGFARDHP
jgi:hypothetical protein